MAETVRFRLQGRVFEVPAGDPRLSRLPPEAEILGKGGDSFDLPPGSASMGPADPSLMRHREADLSRPDFYDPARERFYHGALGNVADAVQSAGEAISSPDMADLSFGDAYQYALERRRRLADQFARERPVESGIIGTAGSMLPLGAGQRAAGMMGTIAAGGVMGALKARPDDPADTLASGEQQVAAGLGGAAETAGGAVLGKFIGAPMRGLGRVLRRWEPAPAPEPITRLRTENIDTGILDAKGNPIIRTEQIPFTETPAPAPRPTFPLGAIFDRLYAPFRTPVGTVMARIPLPEHAPVSSGVGAALGRFGQGMSRVGSAAELAIPAATPDTHPELDWQIWRALREAEQ